MFYGDHLPGCYPEDVFAANGRGPCTGRRSSSGPPRPAGPASAADRSPAHFVDLAAERAGAAVPPYYALLTELRGQLPAIEGGALVGADDGRGPPGR